MNKRIRVYSLETNKLLHLAFARNYVNHLVPALKKIRAINIERTRASSSRNDDENDGNELVRVVRLEVDMAMVLSTKEYNFAWSRALEVKLIQRDIAVHIINGGNNGVNVNSSLHQKSSFTTCKKTVTTTIVEEKAGESLALLPDNPTFANPRSRDLKMIMKKTASNSRRRSRKGRVKKGQEDNVDDRFAHLRTLLPGGNEILEGYNNHELLSEVASYISCLKLQVKVLQCLVELGHE